MKKTMQIHGFETAQQYYNYIAESYIVGQRFQANDLFNKMNKEHKKEFLIYIASGENTALDKEDRRHFMDLL